MAILGGVGTLWGGVIGAVIVLLLRDWLSKRPDLLGVVTGLVFAVIVLGFRRGILGTILHRWESRRPSTRDRPQSSDMAPTLPHAEPERGGTGGS